MNDLKAQYGDRLWLAHLDVTDTPEIHQVVNKAFADLGKIDVVVNNAGYGLFGAAEELTNEQITHQIDTNLIGSIQVVRAALPHLRLQGGAESFRSPPMAARPRSLAGRCITRASGG